MSNTPKPNIIVLDSHDLKTMVVGDISYYPTGFTIVNPTLEVTAPGFAKTTMTVSSKNITVLTSYDLNLVTSDTENVPLPDGIWKIKYSFSPAHLYNVEKSFLKTDNIQAALANAFIQTDLTECDTEIKLRDKQILQDIHNIIHQAVALANVCAEDRAMDMYRIAMKKITNFVNCKK